VALADRGHGSKSVFATAAGVRPESVRKWLAGESDPQFEPLADGCRSLSISLDWLAYGTPPEGIDRQLLADVITAVEEVLAESALALPADRRALLASLTDAIYKFKQK
jgi:hypothetical protein